MFANKGLFYMIQVGGFTMYILLLCSVISFAIIIERLYYYRKRSKLPLPEFMGLIRKEIEKNNLNKALEISNAVDTPYAKVAFIGLKHSNYERHVIDEAMERSTTIETQKLERYTSVIGTIGSTAVYIGLFGTVLGIIRAFRDISQSSAGGINVVIGGISEALICTATGLLVAIPAVIVFNYFVKRVDHFVADMELCSSELLDLIDSNK